MPDTEPDFTAPAWRPYLGILGVQAQALANETAMPADLEEVLEATLRHTHDLIVQMVAVDQQLRTLQARKAAGTWTAEDKARGKQLPAWTAEMMEKCDASIEAVQAVGLRHGLPPA